MNAHLSPVSRDLGRPLAKLALFLVATATLSAANDPYPVFGDRRIKFPDIPGYHTIKGDFHVHTIFSDGKVWPNMRVEEALREDLGAIAITDHLEWNPHRVDVPFPDQNRSFDIASPGAAERGLIVLRAAEITRRMPPESEEPGHLNALFLTDANLLKKDDVVEVLREAARQKAFVTWNHPGWARQTPDGIGRVTHLHKPLLEEGLIQGIEVANGDEYYDEAVQIALDYNLTMIGASDIHAPIDWWYPGVDRKHRPVTFVFARDKTEASLKEAMLDRRTVVWWKNNLIGREKWLVPLLTASITVKSLGFEWETAHFAYLPKTSILNLELHNSTDAEFILRNASDYRFHNQADTLVVPAHGYLPLQVKLRERLADAVLRFEVMNATVAPGKHAFIELKVSSKPTVPEAVPKAREP
jgi:hypothetical protein